MKIALPAPQPPSTATSSISGSTPAKRGRKKGSLTVKKPANAPL